MALRQIGQRVSNEISTSDLPGQRRGRSTASLVASQVKVRASTAKSDQGVLSLRTHSAVRPIESVATLQQRSRALERRKNPGKNKSPPLWFSWRREGKSNYFSSRRHQSWSTFIIWRSVSLDTSSDVKAPQASEAPSGRKEGLANRSIRHWFLFFTTPSINPATPHSRAVATAVMAVDEDEADAATTKASSPLGHASAIMLLLSPIEVTAAAEFCRFSS
jgi:hypothetical protein